MMKTRSEVPLLAQAGVVVLRMWRITGQRRVTAKCEISFNKMQLRKYDNTKCAFVHVRTQRFEPPIAARAVSVESSLSCLSVGRS